ncbi:CRISPR processing complex protein CasB [Methylophaga lonarensis MPL]|uniref:CRISPR processing complex protein CasB n=1 Tax=Methylophaga lonarensis MPL TaxID=1286106 RepID=M7NZ54_9GAMM|nr:type I-E CRISPR-associated protein Cse2/CasB [Methylophaga lonarensis]EMR12517.1 CRISPR processing complex protein CasB [Methylophaga lonarensis MPL]
MSNEKAPDFLAIYEQYQALKPGSQAELRRAVKPADLLEVSAFYQLLKGHQADGRMQRLVYCLPVIKHQAEGYGLGQALAKANISEKRLFMVLRSETPNDLIQLRRLLKMAQPTLDWLKAAPTIYYWGESSKRKLLEDYFYYQNNSAA